MSDLRDRIAAAIKEVDDMRVCKLSNADIKFMAEAVIKELETHYQLVPKSELYLKLFGLSKTDTPPE